MEQNPAPVPAAAARGRRCSLPVLLETSDSAKVFSGRLRLGSFKAPRNKSSFISPIPEVQSSDDEDGEKTRLVSSSTKSEPLSRRCLATRRNDVAESPTSETEAADNSTEQRPNQEDHEFEEICFMRNFKTSPKGIVNRGDSVKRTRRSSTATCTFEHSDGRKKGLWLANELTTLDLAEVALRATSLKNCEIARSVTNMLRNSYKVLIVGDKQVGKTSLTRQLMTSNYLGAMDSPQGKLFFLLFSTLKMMILIVVTNELLSG